MFDLGPITAINGLRWIFLQPRKLLGSAHPRQS